jgi:two-component system, sensor histidine kinase
MDRPPSSRPPSLLRELAHELRDALSPVRSAIDLMRFRRFEPDLSRTLAPRMEHGLDRALGTLDAFILAEQCEDGTATLRPSRTSLQQLLAPLRAALPQALQVRCLIEASGPDLEVTADVARSVEVLAAMLEQALAAAPADATIEVRTAADRGRAQVRVALAADMTSAEGAFESFRSPGGLGRMALRTARCLMRLQQGDLELVHAGAGASELVATFSGEAPGASTARASVAQTPPRPPGRTPSAAVPHTPAAAVPDRDRGAQLRGTRLLMVEDSAQVRRAYREALTAFGYQVTEARNAEEALAAVADAMPAVALIDIHLPGMNGYRLAQALKARAGSAIRLVMLSGVTLDDTTQQISKDAGFDHCFDKARGPKALHGLLLQLL